MCRSLLHMHVWTSRSIRSDEYVKPADLDLARSRVDLHVVRPRKYRPSPMISIFDMLV